MLTVPFTDTNYTMSIGNLTGGDAVAVGVAITFVLSCTLGLLLGAAGYHFIVRKKKRNGPLGINNNLPVHLSQGHNAGGDYAEPSLQSEKCRVDLKRNEAYGQGEKLKTAEYDHSYEFVDH